MAVYTLINKSQLQAFLAYYNLGELVEYKPIQAGTTNSNYEFVTEQNGKRYKYILTIVEQNLSKHDLEFCVAYGLWLQKNNIPVAAAVLDRHGHSFRQFLNKPALVTRYLSGTSLTPDNKAMTTEIYKELGLTLANMHIAGSKFSAQRQNPAGLKWCLNIHDELTDLLMENEDRIIQEEFEYLMKNREKVAQSKLGVGAIHADLFCDNVLLYNNRLEGIIDLFYACTDYFLYDLAVVVNDWVIKPNGQYNEKNYNLLISSYLENLKQDSLLYECLFESIKGNSELWPYMLRKSALRFWLLRLSASLLPKDSGIKTIKDPTEFEIKLLLHREQNLKIFG